MQYSYPVDGLYRAMKELSEKMKQMQSTVDLKFLSEPSTLEAIRNSFAAFGSLSLKVTTPEYFEAIQRAFSVPPIDPEIFTEVIAVGHKAFAVGYDTADTAAGTRHDQSDMFPGHLPSIVEEEGLHGGCHLAPPERSNDDKRVVVGQ